MTRMIRHSMVHRALGAVAITLFTLHTPAHATGLATCDSGPKSGWQSTDVLTKQLTDKGWQVRRIKEDGGCYEVYAIDDKGQRGRGVFPPRDAGFGADQGALRQQITLPASPLHNPSGRRQTCTFRM